MQHPDDRPVYEAFHLRKCFGSVKVLDIEHLRIARGGICGIYGENGSGKTTLFELLLRLQEPTSGTVLFNGREVFPGTGAVAHLRDRVTMVHQNPLLFDTSVAANVAYGLRIRRVSRQRQRQRVAECLQMVGLESFHGRRARHLSGGETQRVAIARALAITPEVLFLDEFSANVDTENREVLERILRTVNERCGTTIVFTSHYLEQAYRMADRVLHLHGGSICQHRDGNYFTGDVSLKNGDTVFSNDRITIRTGPARPGPARIRIACNAIVLSRSPLSSSMRNCLSGVVVRAQQRRNRLFVAVQAGELFEVEITPAAYKEFEICPGLDVCIQFKASAVEVLGQ